MAFVELAIVLVREWKLLLLEILKMPNDAIHIYIGVICFWLVSRKMSGLWRLLIPGLLISLILEVPDLGFNWIAYHSFAWRESFTDIVGTSLIPVLWVASRPGAFRGLSYR